jgi:hypothetical protein
MLDIVYYRSKVENMFWELDLLPSSGTKIGGTLFIRISWK